MTAAVAAELAYGHSPYSVIRTSPEKEVTVTRPAPEPVTKLRDRFGVTRPRLLASSCIPGKLALTLPENDLTRNRASVFEPRASSTLPEWLSMSRFFLPERDARQS